ncbi:hypothetical protein GCM10023096_56060 [Nonomuraea ferruginea]
MAAMVRVTVPPSAGAPVPQEASARPATAMSTGRRGMRMASSCSGRADIPTIARAMRGVKKRSDERFALS